MFVGFLFGIGAPIAILFAAALANLLYRKERTIQYRLAALGFSVALGIAARGAVVLGLCEWTTFWVLVTAFFCWMSGLLYLSFLIEMTATRRSRFFPFAYSIPFALAWLSSVLPRPVALEALVIAGLIVCAWFTCSFMIAWIRASTDERARRDGEWTLMVFCSFASALAVTCFHDVSVVFWLLAIWYLVAHIVVNHLKIFTQLTNLENQLIIDNVFDLVMILDASGRVVRMNRRGYQLTGLSPNAVNGNGIENLVIHGELSTRTRKEWLARYGWRDSGTGSGRTPSIDAVVTTVVREEFPVDLRIVCLTNLEKATTGYIVSATDMRITRQLIKEISDREYATRDLALSESKFSRMFIFNPTGILIVDLDSLEITDANPAIEEILDRESSSLIGKKIIDIGFEMEGLSFEAFIEKIRMEGSVPEFAASVRLSPSSVRKCRLSAVSFELNRTRRMLLSVADVTAQDQLREALTRKQKVETVGILAGGIAHDFNNILAVILGHVGLAKMRVIDQHARFPLEKAEQACIRAREMTRQLLAFSRGGKPVIGVCKTRELVTESAMLAVNDTAVACLFDIEKDVWPLRADKIQVGQVIANLVSNAVDAMDKSGIITIRARNRDFTNVTAPRRPLDLDSNPIAAAPFVEIQIQDQGPGIPESIRGSIFDPFYTTKEKGTGLGLSIVYSVIQNHAGSVRFETTMGEGTVFFICLPADPAGIPAGATEDYPAPGGNKKVLLMDDDSLVRDSAGSILSSLGYEVAFAIDGQEAIDQYRKVHDTGEDFDFCIIDLIVPCGMGGTDCAKGIRAIDPDAILLVSSGYSDDLVLSHYSEYGFSGIIPKPYTVEELKQALARALKL